MAGNVCSYRNKLKSSVVLFACTMASVQSAWAQQIEANGPTDIVNFNGKVDTGNVSSTAGIGLYARNSGSIIADGPVEVVTGGNSAYGVYSLNGTIELSEGIDVSTSGNAAHGLFAANSGSLTANNINIKVDSINSYGAYALSGGKVYLDGGTVDAAGIGLFTLGAEGDGTELIAKSLTIKSVDSGVKADRYTSILLDNVDIITSGSSGHGIYSIGSLANVEARNTSITTNNTSSYGLYSINKGTTTFENVDITTLGGSSHGVTSYNKETITNVSESIIKTYGSGSYGVLSQRGASISLSDTAINSYGANNVGILAFEIGVDDGTLVEADDIEIVSTGDNSYGVALIGGATVNIRNSNFKLSGLNGTSLYSQYYTSGTSQVNIENSSIRSENGSSIVVNASSLVTSIKNTELSGSNYLWNIYGDDDRSSNLVLNTYNSTVQGATKQDTDSYSELNLNDESIWYVSGNSSVNALLNDNSSIFLNRNIAPNGPEFIELSVKDYTGNGGYIYINTELMGDDSKTDRIKLVNSISYKPTTILVNNARGTGAQTDNGILLIEVEGISTGEFLLQGDYVHNGEQAVVAGAYAYKLYQGGVSTPEDGDWYLRSQLIDDEPEKPLYQAGSPVYEAYPQVLLGLNGVSTLQQRTGNRVWSGNGNRVVTQGADAVGSPYAAPDEAGVAINGNGVWGRIEGSHNHIQPRFSTSDTNYNQNVFKMQAGIDGVLTEMENGKLIGGFTVHYAHGKTKTNSAHGDGEIITDGYGLGGTLTWYGENGFYLDGQGQVTWYRSDLHSTTAILGLTDNNHGFGYALSVEGGQRFAINEAWSLTPQAQLTYSSVDFDAFTDAFDADVRLDRGESLQGRLGLTVDQKNSWQNANGMLDRTRVYGIANLYYEFLQGTRVNVAESRFTSRNDRVWGGLGLGGSYNWNDDKYSIYGEGIVNTGLNNFGDSYSIKGEVGFRVKW